MYTATSPNDVKVELMTSEKEVLTAQVFKTIIDPFVGRISYVKVLSGVLSSDSVVSNANNGKPEKVGTILLSKVNTKRLLVNYLQATLGLFKSFNIRRPMIRCVKRKACYGRSNRI